jgi:hypothetical protein
MQWRGEVEQLTKGRYVKRLLLLVERGKSMSVLEGGFPPSKSDMSLRNAVCLLPLHREAYRRNLKGWK